MTEADPIALLAEVKATLRLLLIATLVLYVASIGFVLFYVLPRTNESQTALCALRSDLQTRIVGSEAFLEDHPNGAFGSTAEEIQVSIDNQRRTVTALSGLSCG